MSSPQLCNTIGSGWLFPMTQFEVDLPDPIRVILYGVLLVYFFLGVAMISDIFMSSIDEITSRRRQSLMGVCVTTPKVWNDTVATLSLMALGSSAPEIFLAVVEIFKKEFYIGPLGTSTIVGSAAFNLLMIISVCMVVIPTGEKRIVNDLPAFYITAAFSIFAYGWLAAIVYDEQVQWWEAALTLLLLPVLIFVSYKADVGAFEGLWIRLHLMPTPPRHSQRVSPMLIEFKPQMNCELKGEYVIHQANDSQKLVIPVTCDGSKLTSCKFKTERLTAVPAYHFSEAEGELTFPSHAREQNIEIEICAGCSQIDRTFVVILSEADGSGSIPAEFDPDGNGGKDETCMLVTIRSAKPDLSGHMVEATVGSAFGVRRVRDEWKVQLYEALYCGGSPEDQAEASFPEFAAHLIALPWKMFFSCAPPVYLGQGWARFVWSLFGIACMTMMVSDLAELFGCVLDIPDICTALVFVALGTSMPDLFASLSAAKEDPTADASIVNVTGSNSVNVFLGVGVPYLVAAIHWEGRGGNFIVKTDGLVFSIFCFCIVCMGALVLLHARRQLVGAELGGPDVPKYFCGGVFISFWVAFVWMSSWRVINGREGGVTGSEELIALLVLGGFVVLLTSMAMGVLFKYRVSNQLVEDQLGSAAKDPPVGAIPTKGADVPTAHHAAHVPRFLRAMSGLSGISSASSSWSSAKSHSSHNSGPHKDSARKHARRRLFPNRQPSDGAGTGSPPVSGSFTSSVQGPKPTDRGNDQGEQEQRPAPAEV